MDGGMEGEDGGMEGEDGGLEGDGDEVDQKVFEREKDELLELTCYRGQYQGARYVLMEHGVDQPAHLNIFLFILLHLPLFLSISFQSPPYLFIIRPKGVNNASFPLTPPKSSGSQTSLWSNQYWPGKAGGAGYLHHPQVRRHDLVSQVLKHLRSVKPDIPRIW